MTNQELLELAAKAIGLEGYEWYSDPFGEGLRRRNFDEAGFEIATQEWNPLTNDADAMRLAVDLEMRIGFNNGIANAWSSGLEHYQGVAIGDNRYKAAREAIVLAAVAISKGADKCPKHKLGGGPCYCNPQTIVKLEPGEEYTPLLDFNVLREANVNRDKEWGKGQDFGLSYRGNELAGEVGEACNVLKKLDREQRGLVGSRATIEEAADELADVFICADLAAMQLGINMGEAVSRKFNKTSDKYGLQTKLPVIEP
jgi:NTP pyrophosphatase (non-canonical NTP hydrolase)